MKRAAFIAIMVAIPLAVVAVAARLTMPLLKARLKPALVQYIAGNLSPTERAALLAQMAPPASLWDAVPEPDVGGLGQRNRTLTETGAEVRLNNAGLRDSLPYGERSAETFRIVCLGDSFVFGTGGLESDRFCDQLEAFYREHRVRPGGRDVEALAVGLPGWTLVQAATYLGSRLTSYDPDVVIVLSVANDITDAFGINGAGTQTTGFSPEARALGSAVYSNEANFPFGDTHERGALTWDLSPESRRRWDKALLRLKRLAELQRARGKQLLVSCMAWGRTDDPDAYAALFQLQVARVAVGAPFVMTSFLPGPATSLPHDNHPNRQGHRLLRDQYLHALHRLGWVTVPDSALPVLDPRTPVRLDPAPDLARVRNHQRQFLEAVPQAIDFTALRPQQARAFLGGLFPETPNRGAAPAGVPWASLRASFLLRRPQGSPLSGVEVEIEIPQRAELFPFSLTLLLDGARAAEQRFERPNTSGRYHIQGAPAVPAFNEQVVEVTLETGSYFSTIDDPRMKSYRPVRARAF